MTSNTALWRGIATFLLLLGLFAWPALYNGQGVFFPDTTAYIRGADAGVQAALHHRSRWSMPAEDDNTSRTNSAPAPAAGSVSSIKDKTVLTGRSPFYGTLLYLGDWAGGFWLSIALQSLAAIAALILTLRALSIPRAYLPGIAIVLALLTSLPFFVSFLMPDIFTGIVIAGGAVLLSVPGRPLAELASWFVLLATGALFHDSHTLILAAFLVLAVVANLLARNWSNRVGLLVILLSLGVAALGQAAFGLAVKHSIGVAPLRPPFLTARLIEDGPGLKYLRASCPASGFEVCAYLDRLPMMADDFLWQTEPGAAVFATASPEVKRRLSAEQFRFVRAVLAFDPLGQLAASARNAGLELVSVGLWEFQYQPEEKASFELKVPAEPLARMRRSAAFRGTMPINIFTPILIVGFYCAAAFIAVTLGRRQTRRMLPAGVAATATWLLIGVVLNAVCCGVLSGPHERYAARAEWLVPLAAMLVAAGLASRRAKTSAERA